MTNKDITIDDWNPSWDDDAEVVWATEWFAPEGEMTDEELEAAYITMRYRGNVVGRWYYTEIQQALGDKGIDAFLADKNITDATDADKEELHQFFKHWTEFLKMSTGGMVFESDEVNEEIGDDILGEIDSDYAKLGKDSNLVEDVKRNLH